MSFSNYLETEILDSRLQLEQLPALRLGILPFTRQRPVKVVAEPKFQLVDMLGNQ